MFFKIIMAAFKLQIRGGGFLVLWVFFVVFLLSCYQPLSKHYTCIQKQVLQIPDFSVGSLICESHLLLLYEFINPVSEIT